MLIIIAAHIPIFTLQRQEGRMFAPMAYSVTSALIGALILALTVVPLFCYWWLRRDRMRDGNPLMDRLTGWYRPVLERALARPRAVVLTAVALLVGTLAWARGWVRVPARAGRGIDLADRHARPEHQPGRSAAAVAAHP
jgi:cobalt-zinc-cadmium resistance protein CzcA